MASLDDRIFASEQSCTGQPGDDNDDGDNGNDDGGDDGNDDGGDDGNDDGGDDGNDDGGDDGDNDDINEEVEALVYDASKAAHKAKNLAKRYNLKLIPRIDAK